jgi:hypothetical protein
MATSLLKFSFKTGLVKAIISEIASNISKYYYTFGKADPWFSITGLTATLEANSNSVVLTSGSTDGFLIGQIITQTGGIGEFETITRVESIVSSTEFIVTNAHVTSGDVVFNIDDESVIEEAIDSYEYEISTRNNKILYKQIDANDVAPVIPRINWQAGYVFDMYKEYSEEYPAFSGATALNQAEFYALTDQYHVYKCLDNNNNSPSIFKPTSTSNVPFQTDDNYIWKYMYTIPITLRNKFLTSTLMPVTTALTTQFYSKGSIVGYSIENPGSGYNLNSYKITGFRIINSGLNYTGEPSIIIEPAHQENGEQAVVAEVVVEDGKIVQINMEDEGSGYSYPPLFTLTGTADVEAIIEPIVENTGISYTNLIVSGDGYLEENPYVVDSIEVIDGGSGYESVTLLFTTPDLPNGIKAEANVIVDENGTVTSIEVVKEGFGYSNMFYSIMDDLNAANVVRYEQTNLGLTPGSGLEFRIVNKKNEAEIAPIINADGQIEQIRVIKPGIGYTFASVIVEPDFDTTMAPGFEPASLLLDFGVGNIESNQSTVEITSVPGAIYAIDIKNAGLGYLEAPTITIQGDGIGATAEAVITEFGTLQKIVITNPGSGYTVATATLSGVATQPAELDVILPPKDGHGSDAISELFSKTIMFKTSLFKDSIYRRDIDNSFRQVCLVKNPKVFNSRTNLRLGISTSAILAIGSNNQPDYTRIVKNDILTIDGKRYLVISKYDAYDENNNALLLSYLDNRLLSAGETIGKEGANFVISSVILPGVNKFSGEILTVDNRIKFTPSSDQIIVASNTITF